MNPIQKTLAEETARLCFFEPMRVGFHLGRPKTDEEFKAFMDAVIAANVESISQAISQAVKEERDTFLKILKKVKNLYSFEKNGYNDTTRGAQYAVDLAVQALTQIKEGEGN